MNWLTAKMVQGIAAALLVLCLGLGAQVFVQSKRLDVAIAEMGAAESARDAAVTERESWKEQAKAAKAANTAYDLAFSQLQESANETHRMAKLQAEQAERAIVASKAKAATAARELAEFRRMFGQRPAGCVAALQALDKVCPTLRNY